MSGPVEIVLVIAAVGYLLVRRVTGEPAQAKRMLVLPAVLSVVGLSDVSGHVGTPLSLLFLVAAIAISVGIGALRGASVRISRRDGLAFVRYTGVTVALWAVNLAVKFGGDVALRALDPKDAGGVGDSVLLTLGLGILAEGAVVLYRALRGDHPVMWAAGRDGGPHRMSPLLDSLRDRLTDRGGKRYADPGARGWETVPGQPRDHRR